MRLWQQDGPLQEDGRDSRMWRLPKFIHHDQGTQSSLLLSNENEEASIILMEDLGEVAHLFKRLQIWAESGVSPKTTNAVSRIGDILGYSLAKFHSQKASKAIHAHPEIAQVLSQKLTDDVVWYLSMELLPEYLEKVFNGDKYFQRLVKDVKSPEYTYPLCLQHGDFNFGNIVLPLSEDDNMYPYVIDWEFGTGRGRGVNGDISEFLSLLHCRLIIARTEESGLGDLIRTLLQKFCSAYRQEAGLKCTMSADDVNSQLYRSALLLTGRDILVYAFDACQDETTFKEMFNLSVWYFERAGDDMDEFLQESNRLELMNEDEGLIRSLFIFE